MEEQCFLTNGHLSRVSHLSYLSRLSDNDKNDGEVKSGAVNRSPEIYLKAEENSGKPQLGDCLMNTMRPIP